MYYLDKYTIIGSEMLETIIAATSFTIYLILILIFVFFRTLLGAPRNRVHEN